MGKEMPKWMYPVNAAIILGVLFLIPSVGNIGSDEAAGKLDDHCDPFIGYLVASWVTPESFWKKQVNYFTKAVNAPFQPPSIEARKLEVMVAQAASKEIRAIQQIRAEQPQLPRDPVLARADALRAEADRLEAARGLQLADQRAYQQFAEDHLHAQACLNKSNTKLSR
jgi:hypothetical protein